MNEIPRRASYLLLGLGALASLGVIYQALADARDRRRYPPPGQRVDIGGRRLHLYCVGEGSPTVILEAALNGCCIDWCQVQPQVASFTRVCSYDRAGYGWSDSGPRPRTAPRMARELHTLLSKAEIEPPYVLVGHSYGGELVRVYADQYPEDVVGMVLVDSSHEDQIERVYQIMSRKERMLDNLHWQFVRLRPVLARLGIMRLTRQALQGIEIYPSELRPTAIALEEQSSAFDWTFGEASAIPQCNAYLRAAQRLRNIPLAVISAGLPQDPEDPLQQALRQVWTELQSELAKLSPRGRHIIAEESGHIVQLDQPELVVAAIREIVEEVRAQLA